MGVLYTSMKLSPTLSAFMTWALLLVVLGFRPTPNGGFSPEMFIGLLAGYFIVRPLSLLFALAFVWRSSGRGAVTLGRLVEEAGFDVVSELTATALWCATLGGGFFFIIEGRPTAVSESFLFVFLGGSVIIPILSLWIAWLCRTESGRRLKGWLVEKSRPAATVSLLDGTKKPAAIALSLLLLSAYVARVRRADRLERELALENARIKQLSCIAAKVEELEHESSALRTRAYVVQELRRERQRLPGFLSQLRGAMRGGVELRQLTIQSPSASSITVSAPRSSDLEAWLETFSSLKWREDQDLHGVSVRTSLPSIGGSRLLLTVFFDLR